MHFINFVTWLNNSPWSVWLRENDYAFATIETFHILGLGLSVGTIMWVDLRLIGISMKRYRVKEMVRQLEQLALYGFLVMFISGFLLLCSEPLKCYTILAFRLKATMLPLAGLNVLYFHSKGVFGTVSEWDEATITPWRARMVGTLSLILWFGIIIAGRWTAYTS
ncbi:MAG TPA: DUF6644 family protein [Nitrososphaera sp.]|nr:DUF6644 family protein [Nitrososphaera sp.]